eukprot:GFYU01005960.1.p1 GENE.GFYU01005960.1~~GFYU01005960.1.p1  ORF type:complete len:381 (-),score=63.34 GFYU01005960.1:57-1157(-)
MDRTPQSLEQTSDQGSVLTSSISQSPLIPGHRHESDLDRAVRDTNDDAAVSKLSAVRLGYWKDEYVKHFVKTTKFKRRPPIINKGYWTRVRGIEVLMEKFVESDGGSSDKQFIILGAGSDTRYFKYRDAGFKPKKYIEIDFPEVVAHKAAIIEHHNELHSKFGDEWHPDCTKDGELHCDGYHLVGCDLSDLHTFEVKLSQCGFNPRLPTFILSECVMIYMKPAESQNLIAYLSSKLPKCVFVTYEQIHPFDYFGQQMIENLEKRGCILQGIQAYPDLPSQVQRYKDAGFTEVEGGDMIGVHYGFSQEELSRVDRIEIFDEVEEWDLIQSHYFLLWARKEPPGAPHTMSNVKLPLGKRERVLPMYMD